jgi:G2/mitotic-specific cyclin 1/2
MEVQSSVMFEHREIAIIHLLSVQQQYEMSSETLFQAVGYLNSVLAVLDCPGDRMNLFALTSFWMVAKLEESGAPKLSDLCFIAKNAYTEDEFAECERFILQLPGFRLLFPTVPIFLRSFLEWGGVSPKGCEVANFFSELSLLPTEFMCLDPSLIAMACACLGEITLGGQCPTQRLTAIALHSVEEARACCPMLIELARKVLAHPRHLLYQRYTAPPSTGAILEMQLTEGLFDRLGETEL